MSMTPRKSEIDAIVALLEGDSPDATSLSKAIVRQAYASLLEREWWLTVVRLPDRADGSPTQIAYGLSASEFDARRVELGEGFPRMFLPVTSARGHIDHIKVLEKAPTTKETKRR